MEYSKCGSLVCLLACLSARLYVQKARFILPHETKFEAQTTPLLVGVRQNSQSRCGTLFFRPEMLSAKRFTGMARLDHQVVVVAHQTIGIADPPQACTHLLENIREKLPVAITEVNIGAGVAPRGQMV
ncbi:MAG: hypothetical protein ETSY2_09600 [Candidatus Entotheonella gemina]|uniref:Uncharacterized protein n=1 Tax=Candidatus Entotheonella gemina TaxID=1429439 RepID=W4MBJ1_9BACT|nr:MAG: hypothetical protein ETSY2_09600 [Candidatus Entotheonella gemina]